MADAFISLVAVQPSAANTSQSGVAAGVPSITSQQPIAGHYSTIRTNGGVKTK